MTNLTMTATSLSNLQRSQGAVFSSNHATLVHFGDPAVEAQAAHESAAIFDLSDWSHIEITGADCKSFLHNFCTNDINSLAPGAGCEAFLTNIKGRLLGHILVIAGQDVLRLVSVPDSAAGIIEHLDRYLIAEDAELHDRTQEIASLCLVGPRAAGVLNEQPGVDVADLTMYAQADAEKASAKILRVPFALQPAYLLSVPTESVAELWQCLAAAGATPAGNDVWNAVRIAAGFPLYGVDVSETNIAQEAGRTAQAISFTKGCYLGQEPIARLDALGHVNRLLCRLQVDASMAAPGGAAVLKDEVEVGSITSSSVDHLAGEVVALAVLKAKIAELGADVSIRFGDDMVAKGTVFRGGN